MATSKYHRDQAIVLASLALSTQDPVQADRFQRAAQEHLERAKAMDSQDTFVQPPPGASEQGFHR
jgi:hypothetical protein